MTGRNVVFDNFLLIIFIGDFLKSASPSVTRHLKSITVNHLFSFRRY